MSKVFSRLFSRRNSESGVKRNLIRFETEEDEILDVEFVGNIDKDNLLKSLLNDDATILANDASLTILYDYSKNEDNFLANTQSAVAGNFPSQV